MSAKRIWRVLGERERERTAGRNWKQDQIYGCLFNRAIQLHYPRQNINRESDVERRSITQVFLFCATTGETMTSGKCSAHPVTLFLFTVIHAHSIPFNSPCFFPVVFSLPASLFLPLTLYHSSLFCSAELMRFRGQMSQRERSVSSFSFSLLFSMLEQPSLWFPEVALLPRSFSLSLSFIARIQFQRFMGSSEMYKWRGSLLSVLLCLFSFGVCRILTLSRLPLLLATSSVPFIFALFPVACTDLTSALLFPPQLFTSLLCNHVF